MPNVKLFMDQAVLRRHDAIIDALLLDLRRAICSLLGVADEACHIAVVAVRSLPDQPAVNLEIHILPKPERTRDRLETLCRTLRDTVQAALSERTAVRCALLDPVTYIALK